MTIIEKNSRVSFLLANVPVWHVGHDKNVLVAVSIEVALRDPKGDIPGRLVLIFDSETLALQGWRLLDIQQQRSTVWLHNVIRHARFPEDYFRIDESIAEAEDE